MISLTPGTRGQMGDSVSIVVPTKFEDIFTQLAESVARLETFQCRKIAVVDGDWMAPAPWITVRGVDPFIFARNANLGIRAAGEDDVLLCNDDVTWRHQRTVEYLQKVASATGVGIVSPQFDGGAANPLQMRNRQRINVATVSQGHLAFVCVYIPRRTIDAVGPMDERFVGYGGDDVDYCLSVQAAGLKLVVTNMATMRHGFGRGEYSSSFLRVMQPGERERSMLRMDGLVRDKWAK